MRVAVDSGDSETQSLQPSREVEPVGGDSGDDEGHAIDERTLIYTQSVQTSTMGNVGEISIRWLFCIPRLTRAVAITSGWEAGGLPPSRLELAVGET